MTPAEDASSPRVAVLFARKDSIYKTMDNVDVYDIDRDARTYDGPWPVVAHPPCRAWAGLRRMATRTRPDEKNLARLAVALVREFGGVLEHPRGSILWRCQGLPEPGKRDGFGGWTLQAPQRWWGHRAEKMTRFYIRGCEPSDAPDYPLVLGVASMVVTTSAVHKRHLEIAKPEREATPPLLAQWLVDLASQCQSLHAAPGMARP